MTTLKELIDANAKGLGQDYAAIAAVLNAPTEVVNPDAGKKTDITEATPITLEMVMAATSAEEMAAVYKFLPTFVADLKQAIDSGSRAYLARLLQIAAAATDDKGALILSSESAQKLTAILTATTTTTTTAPDTIAGPSLAESAGLGVVTAMQVQAALN